MKKRILMGILALSITATGLTGTMGVEGNIVHAESVNTEAGIASFGKGTASITIKGNSGQSLIGKQFNLYKLFDAENAKGGESIRYKLNPEYKAALQNVVGKALSKTPTQVTEYEIIDYIQSMNTNIGEGTENEQELEGRSSLFRYFVEELRDELVRLAHSSDSIIVNSVGSNNTIQVTGLPFGYYIIDEVSENEGAHSASSLCMVNTANPNAMVNMKSDYPSVTKKIQEDDHQTSIGNNGWNDVGDYEIGQSIPYCFESNVPNMNGYETYYYAWHDVMDPALVFQKDSVKISISNNSKTYILADDEYVVRENVDGNTFKVVVQNLKKIVDREFNQIDELGHNIYGQMVTLCYDATLGDRAANDTGRPGFENDVRLEFSNDPDSDGSGKTGFTPWDTVVCFTYKLNVMKINNHNLALADAKFRLYEDKDCTEEVFVKKSTNGYIVINKDSAGEGVPASAVEMSSAEDGTFVIYGLDQGTYYLKETEAPAGYRAILDPIVLNVTPTFTNERNSYVKGDGATEKTLQTLECSAYLKQFFSGVFTESHDQLECDVQEGAGNLTVVNQVGTKLPVTGSGAMITILALGIGIMIATQVIPSEKSRKL